MVSPHSATRDIAEAGLMRMVRTVAVLTPCMALIEVLANSHDYRQPAVTIAVWLVVLAAAAWLVPRLRTGGLSARRDRGGHRDRGRRRDRGRTYAPTAPTARKR